MTAKPIVWETPPPAPLSARTQPDAELMEFADALRARPGEWAHYPRPLSTSSADVTARNIKKGISSSFRPAGSFEACTRSKDGGRVVFVRYIGEDGSA